MKLFYLSLLNGGRLLYFREYCLFVALLVRICRLRHAGGF